MEAALRVTSRKGVSGATMQEIADAAGIAKGTLYLYFKTREDLVHRSAEHALSGLVGALGGALAEPGAFRERLRRLVQLMIGFFHENRDFLRLYLSTSQGDGGARPGRHSLYERHLRQLSAFLEEAMRKREIRPSDPERLALFVTEGINAVIRRRLADPSPPPPEQDVEWIAATLLDGVSRERSAV
jgi:TetR/AcrR family fatty acid metabolism transcriptional regulator